MDKIGVYTMLHKTTPSHSHASISEHYLIKYFHQQGYRYLSLSYRFKGLSMKLLTNLSCLILLGLITTQLAQATGDEFKGKTTCSILKAGKLIKKSPCSYTGLIFGSIRHNETSYEFNIPGYGKMTTSLSISAKTDHKGEMIESKDGVEYEAASITLNDRPATPLQRYSKTLKIIPDDYYYKNSERLQKTSLSCMQQTKTKLEVCIPVKDGFLGGS